MTTLTFIILGQFDPNEPQAYLGGVDATENYMTNVLDDLHCHNLPEDHAVEYRTKFGGENDRLYRVSVKIEEVDDVHGETTTSA